MAEFGFLMCPTLRRKPRTLIYSLAKAATGKDTKVFDEYKTCTTLILYGWGGRIQQSAIEQHRGDYVCFDLGYWERDGFTFRKWRVSINGFHSPGLIFKTSRPSASRLRASRLPFKKRSGDPEGPILLVGSGPKSQRVVADRWSERKAQELRDVFPDREIWYKPKPNRPPERHVKYNRMVTDEIFDVLPKVSLVVCRHSNVAVDACRIGVPVVCNDGAAAAIYPSELEKASEQPSVALRQEFLERLAYWQWSIHEIRSGQFWPWLDATLAEIKR